MRYICSEHDSNEYKFPLCFICPNTIAEVKDYYNRSLIPRRDCCSPKSQGKIYKIKTSYILIDEPFFHRFDPIYVNVYKHTVSVGDDNILYDLTLAAILNLLIKNKDLYIGILPKDIIGIITPYLL